MSANTNTIKFSQLPIANTAGTSDRLVLVSLANPSNPALETISISNIYTTANSINVANTPANSSITVSQGSIFMDLNYLYVAVANNVLKRVALGAF